MEEGSGKRILKIRKITSSGKKREKLLSKNEWPRRKDKWKILMTIYIGSIGIFINMIKEATFSEKRDGAKSKISILKTMIFIKA